MKHELIKIKKFFLKKRIKECTKEQQDFFIRLYDRTANNTDFVVDHMDDSKLKHAIFQVENTISKK